jgi:hypothetical protein
MDILEPFPCFPVLFVHRVSSIVSHVPPAVGRLGSANVCERMAMIVSLD